MQSEDRPPATVRALLESTGTAFTIARYPPRAALFVQGDPCDSVMHIETGRVWLAVTRPGGKEAICGLLAGGAFLGEELPQRIIAEMVGTTRSRVNFFMGQFKKGGFVAEDDGVLAVNPLFLRAADNGHRHSSLAASLEAI